jgi:hypothetical protein
MIDEREHLERALRRFRPESGIVERVYRRRDRKQRNQRIAAAVVGLILAGTAWGVLARSFLSHGPVPADEPPPTPSAVTGWPQTEEEARALMIAFLEARLSGSGAEPLVECCQGYKRDYELNMYETSGGSPYVGYEIELVDPSILGWDPSISVGPQAEFLFRVTLFAEDGTTVEEWPYLVGPGYGERRILGCCYFQTRERTP